MVQLYAETIITIIAYEKVPPDLLDIYCYFYQL